MRGVSYHRAARRWRATLGREVIGWYATEGEAVAARQAAELLFHGHPHEQAEIEIDGDCARVPLWARGGVVRGWALIDAVDVPLVAGHRWSLLPSLYAVTRGKKSPLYMHRVILSAGEMGDHISGDTLDNRRSNLRPCSPAENRRNSRVNRSSRTGFKGVTICPSGRFAARIRIARKDIWLGRFDSKEEAARAYDAAAVRLFGAFARPNFPSDARAA